MIRRHRYYQSLGETSDRAGAISSWFYGGLSGPENLETKSPKDRDPAKDYLFASRSATEAVQIAGCRCNAANDPLDPDPESCVYVDCGVMQYLRMSVFPSYQDGPRTRTGL